MALWLCCQQAPPGPGAAAGRWTLPPAAGGGCPGCLALSLAGLSVSQRVPGRVLADGGLGQVPLALGSVSLEHATLSSSRWAALWPGHQHSRLPPSLRRAGSATHGRAPAHPTPRGPCLATGPPCRHRLVSDPARPAAPYLLVSRTKKQSALSGRASEHQMSHRVPSAWLCAEASG